MVSARVAPVFPVSDLDAALAYYRGLGFGARPWHGGGYGTIFNRELEDFPAFYRAMSALVEDLHERGLDKDVTVIAWGEFGRTPRISKQVGRDHWPRSWSVVVGGGGTKGGQVIGATDKDGVDITDRPLGVMDLIATMTKSMGMKLDTQYTTPRGRPIKIVDGGQPIKELFA